MDFSYVGEVIDGVELQIDVQKHWQNKKNAQYGTFKRLLALQVVQDRFLTGHGVT